jgi:hypothetical protein
MRSGARICLLAMSATLSLLAAASGDCRDAVQTAAMQQYQHLTVSYNGPSDGSTQGMGLEVSFLGNDINAPRRVEFSFYGEAGRTTGRILIADSANFAIDSKLEYYVAPLFSDSPQAGVVGEQRRSVLLVCEGKIAESLVEDEDLEIDSLLEGVRSSLAEAFPFLPTREWLTRLEGEQ